jgi:FkbH-like protein
VFLLISAAICGSVGRRLPKPRHAVVLPGRAQGSSELGGLVTAIACYRRLAILGRVPLASVFSEIRSLNKLLLRAYSPSVHVGRDVMLMGRLYDPDLTEIGDNAVVGGSAAIVAHSMVIRPDGALVYVSAPVKIGTRATIGGEARVALGCTIGEDAVVEAGAVVEPFTRIGPGEIWGGNPARFRRRRDDAVLDDAAAAAEAVEPRPAGAGAEEVGNGRATTRDQVRRLVVEALALNAEEAPAELSTTTCTQWDSLGQVVIAAAILDRFGIAVDGSDVFRLRSVQDIVNLVGRGAPVATAATPDRPAHPVAQPLPDDVEMLPLLDPQAATRALAESLDGVTADAAPIRVNVVASFTAQPIAPALKLWGRAFGFEIECRFAEYDQIVQSLLTRDRATRPPEDEVTVVLTRPEDFPAEPSAATAKLEQILDAVEAAASRAAPSSRLFVGTLPSVVSSLTAVDRSRAAAMREHWHGRLATMPRVELFDFSYVVERVGLERARSSSSELASRAPYSGRLYQQLAIELIRCIRRRQGRKAKVVALDCDNTLWGGVVGEVGLEGLELGADGAGRSFQLFQEYLKRLKDRGLLLVVVSKNEEHDVREVFARHPEMVLRPNDIAAWRVNWRHKSDNPRELAEELNLGRDSFVLLDDDPVARMEVQSRLPEVHVVPLGEDPATFCDTLERLWLFDGGPVTNEDATRTQKAQQEERRNRERAEALTLDDFLARLELEVDMKRPGGADWPRVAQLTQRTNQFNLSLKRRTLEEMRMLDRDATVLVLEARDRFGDYGQVGVCVLQPGEQSEGWEIETLLMSCRALGRGAEDAFLHGIAVTAARDGATRLIARYVEGARNAQMEDFLARSGFEEFEPDMWSRPLDSLPPLPGHVRFRDFAATPVPPAGQRRA